MDHNDGPQVRTQSATDYQEGASPEAAPDTHSQGLAHTIPSVQSSTKPTAGTALHKGLLVKVMTPLILRVVWDSRASTF